MATARIVMPKTARKGEIIEIKARITHVMESGFRNDNVGRPIPRDILTRFACSYDGETVFLMELFTGVAANPFVAFSTIATKTGELVFTWTNQQGFSHTERTRLEVT